MEMMIKEEVNRVGYEYVTHRALSAHKDDWYLQVVYAYKDMESGDREFVVWVFNAERIGLHEGYYTMDREAAKQKFWNKK